MAETLTYEFILQQTLDVDYTGGDIVSVYYDDVADDMVVRVNGGAPESVGPTFYFGSVLISKNENYSFCTGDDLTYFGLTGSPYAAFPYVQKLITLDSPTCMASACDILITNIDTTDDTGASDGTAIINSFSSATTIEYSIDGSTYTTNNTFTGLAEGDYTAYVRDELGCEAQKDFTIQPDVSTIVYGDKYICSFDNIENETKIIIQEKDYAGASEEVCCMDFSHECRSQSVQSYLDYTLRPSSINLTLKSDTNFKFISLFTASNKRYRAILKRDDVEQWRGYILPSNFSEPYVPPPYPTNVVFQDGIALLSGINASDFNITGDVPLITILHSYLRHIGLGLPYHLSISVFGASMNANRSVLSQTLVNYDSFVERELNCYDALNEALRGFGCGLWQWGGAWWVIRHDERRHEFTYFVYNNLEYASTATYDPIVNFDCPNVNNTYKAGTDASFEIMPAFGTIIYTSDMDRKESLLYNNDFDEVSETDSGDFISFRNWTYVQGGAGHYIDKVRTRQGENALSFKGPMLKTTGARDGYIASSPAPIRYGPGDKIRFTMDCSFDKIDGAIPFVIVKVMVQLGDDQWLTNDGVWQSSEDFLRFYPRASSGFTSVKIEADLPDVSVPTTEYLRCRVYCYASDDTEVNDDISDLTDVVTVGLRQGYKIDVHETDGFDDYKHYYELITGPNGDVVPDDYNASTNDVTWKLEKTLRTNNPVTAADDYLVDNTEFIIDNVNIEYLPVGFEVVESQKVVYEIDSDNQEVLDTSLQFGPLPRNFTDDRTLTYNDNYNYASHYKYADGSFIEDWGRVGLNESLIFQTLYISTLAEQHQNPTFKIYGRFYGGDFYGSGSARWLAPFDSLYNTMDNKLYLIEDYSCLDIQRIFQLEIIELKAAAGYGAFSEFDRDDFDYLEFN